MRIKLTSVFVDDQDEALEFYTEVLGFVKKQDFPVGDARWLTVVSPDEYEGTELVLEPNGNPASRDFTEKLYEQGIPYTAFQVDDIEAEYERMRGIGVRFIVEPTQTGGPTIAVFDDSCGNLIQMYEV